MDIELVLDAHAIIAESPTWVAEENAVYWIDVKAPALHRLDLATRVDREWRLASDVGAFALIAGRHEALVALRHGLFRLDLATGALVLEVPPPFDPARHRFNEGACDSTGRFWVGTMFDPMPDVECNPERSGMSSFTLSGGLRPEPDAAELHNGMAWSRDEATFYLSHSQQQAVFAFPYDRVHGSLGSRRAFVTIPAELGLPDGAAVDAAGGYWCALHGSGRLHRYRPDGTLDREIMLPVSQPTMCAFVGADLDMMMVTTASDKLSPRQLAEQPHAGGLFCFRPSVRGIPRHYQLK
ncbi:SMP-30/gluconolactonase/LRE family protein [Rhodopila sp.]|uniref:SMP-30/gluconolactonase/LRE family protein n=1 Tax=Rhodopila sp. TaxID=2480087 RepID=UPI003D10C0D4